MSFIGVFQIFLWHSDQDKGCHQENLTFWAPDLLPKNTERNQDPYQIQTWKCKYIIPCERFSSKYSSISIFKDQRAKKLYGSGFLPTLVKKNLP